MRYMILIALAYLLAACPKAKAPEPKVEDAAVKMDAVVIESGSPLD